MTEPDLLYPLTRLGLSVVAAVSWTWLLVLVVRVARRRVRPEPALRIVSIVWVAVLVAVFLLFGAVVQWDRPAEDDPFFAFLTIGLRAVLAVSGTVFVWTWAR